MIAGAPLSAGELIDLLDWIDKVRVGLWLAMFYLNSNYRSIIPQFHIDDRVGRQDRALLIYRSSNSPQGIAMVGIDSPIFHSMPSVMGLFVNQLCFISLSKPFLLAEHFGWPTIHNARMKDVDTDGFFADVVPGSNKLAPVILDGLPAKPGTALFQPIAYIGGENSYDAPHVTQTSQQGKVGVGKLFVGNEATSLYPTEKSPTWMPSTNTSFNDLSSELTTWIASMQEKLFLDLPDFSHFPDADRIAREKEIRGIVKLHRMMVEHDVKSSSIAP